MIDLTLLESLSNAVGVANAETEVRKLIRDAIRDRVIDPVVDVMGNLIVRRVGTGKVKLRVLITAHMDETGFIVTQTDDNGLIHVAPMGRPDPRYAPTHRVVLGKDKVPGVFLFAPIHKSYGKNDVPGIDDLHVDIGASGKPGVKVGDRAAYMGDFRKLTDRVVRGKAFESRAAVALLIALLKGDPFPFDVYAAFTTQRTVQARGAKVAAARVKPDVAMVLSGTEADDLPRDPDDMDRAALIRLGGGPVLHLLDGLAVLDRLLLAHLRDTAAKLDIPIQQDVLAGFSEASQTSGEYAAVSGSVGIPVRYMTGPNALLDLHDLEQTEKLLRQALNTLTPELLKKDVIT
jgi:endoglucanase